MSQREKIMLSGMLTVVRTAVHMYAGAIKLGWTNFLVML